MQNESHIYTQSIPSLQTERLLLRGPRLEDFNDSAAMWGDPEVTRYAGGRPFSREEVWARLQRYVGHWMLLSYGFWIVRERDTDQFVGEVGLADFKRDLDEPWRDWSEGGPEVGWVLARAAHGRGFATEAVSAALAWGETRFADSRMLCMINPENSASIRVAHKCGFREHARTTYKERPIILFERGEDA